MGHDRQTVAKDVVPQDTRRPAHLEHRSIDRVRTRVRRPRAVLSHLGEIVR